MALTATNYVIAPQVRPVRAYRDVRKNYIDSRQDEILAGARGRLSRRDAKELACQEFDDLIKQERQIAVEQDRAQRVEQGGVVSHV